ncbi:MAG: FtsX-like permease family protein [Nitrospiraceae bacterium]|nr:FtsX-like permease family protein [Nitrospiraceae bacterium]
MGFLRLALTNLKRHRTRSLLTIVGIAASVAVLFSILSYNRGFERGLVREFQKTGIHFMVVPSGCAHEVASLVLHGAIIPKYLDLEVVARISGLDGIEIISPLLVAQLPNTQKNRVDLIYGMEMKHLRIVKPAWRVKGSVPEKDSEIIVGSEVAAHYNLKPGDMVSYPNVKTGFRVAGVLEKTDSQDDAFTYLPLSAAQQLLDKPGGATAVGVKVKDPELVGRITETLTEKVPGIQIVTMNQVMNSILNLAASAKALSLSIAFIAIFISAVGVMNSILMTVFERTNEIGMMRAVGASRADIFRMVVIETTMLTFSGGVLGIIISLAGSRLIESFVRKVMPYVPSGEILALEPGLAAGSIMFAFFIGIASSLYPAWKASKINPVEAIKG